MFRRLLIWIAKLLPKNKKKSYPQLWYYWGWLGPKIKQGSDNYRLPHRVLHRTCQFLTGHEPSNTEWGYGGGNYVDRWCRWCNYKLSVRIEEEILPKKMKDIMNGHESPEER